MKFLKSLALASSFIASATYSTPTFESFIESYNKTSQFLKEHELYDSCKTYRDATKKFNEGYCEIEQAVQAISIKPMILIKSDLTQENINNIYAGKTILKTFKPAFDILVSTTVHEDNWLLVRNEISNWINTNKQPLRAATVQIESWLNFWSSYAEKADKRAIIREWINSIDAKRLEVAKFLSSNNRTENDIKAFLANYNELRILLDLVTGPELADLTNSDDKFTTFISYLILDQAKKVYKIIKDNNLHNDLANLNKEINNYFSETKKENQRLREKFKKIFSKKDENNIKN